MGGLAPAPARLAVGGLLVSTRREGSPRGPCPTCGGGHLLALSRAQLAVAVPREQPGGSGEANPKSHLLLN